MLRTVLVSAILVCASDNVVPHATTVQDMILLGVPYGNTANPESLQLEDVERWTRMLAVSEDQCRRIITRYEHFVARHNEFMETTGREYLRQSQHVGELQSAGEDLTSPIFAAALHDLRSATEQFQQKLERLELEFIDSLVPDLTESQVDQLYLLRNEASRRQSRSFPHFSRWSNVDLRLVWEAVWSDDVSESDNSVMAAILANYEIAVTPLLDRSLDRYWDIVVDLVDAAVDHAGGDLSDDQFLAKYKSLWNGLADVLKRIRVATESAVSQAESQLSPAVAREFVNAAKRCAFPEIYPDPDTRTELFANLVGDQSIAKHQQILADMQMAYETEYRAVSMELESFIVEWGDHLTRGEDGYQHQFFGPALKPFVEKRNAVNRQWLDRLSELLGADIVKAHMPAAAEPPSKLLERARLAGTIRPYSARPRTQPQGIQQPAPPNR